MSHEQFNNRKEEVVNLPTVDITEEQYDKLFSINTKGAFFHNTRSSKIAPMFLVEVLAKEIGYRGVTVNTIVPTAIEGAGVWTNPEDRANFKNSFVQTHSMERFGTLGRCCKCSRIFC